MVGCSEVGAIVNEVLYQVVVAEEGGEMQRGKLVVAPRASVDPLAQITFLLGLVNVILPITVGEHVLAKYLGRPQAILEGCEVQGSVPFRVISLRDVDIVSGGASLASPARIHLAVRRYHFQMAFQAAVIHVLYIGIDQLLVARDHWLLDLRHNGVA